MVVQHADQQGKACAHIQQVHDVLPRTEGCEECMKTGDPWVALSLCLTCGHVGCCYDSTGQHAWKHFEETQHPVIQAFKRRGQNWRYCYLDEVTV